MMANEEHVRILRQGVETWNRWRENDSQTHPDLGDIHLVKANLAGFNLSGANLARAQLQASCLVNANLTRCDLSLARASEVDLTDALLLNVRLVRSDLAGAILTRTDLVKANLGGAELSEADLSSANLESAILRGALFTRTNLAATSFRNARVGWSTFCDVDLSSALGLDQVIHVGPSTVGIDTLYRSGGRIPRAFLSGAGVSDEMMAYARALQGEAMSFYSCFFSYASDDTHLVKRLHADLRNKKVRCWFAPEDMKIGDRIRPRIDESIQQHDRLLLVLSEHSVASAWVEQEVETALDRERRHGKTVLFPIRLDDAVMNIETGWPALIRNTRHIGDFTRWKDHDAYQAAFVRLLKDLKAEGG